MHQLLHALLPHCHLGLRSAQFVLKQLDFLPQRGDQLREWDERADGNMWGGGARPRLRGSGISKSYSLTRASAVPELGSSGVAGFCRLGVPTADDGLMGDGDDEPAAGTAGKAGGKAFGKAGWR